MTLSAMKMVESNCLNHLHSESWSSHPIAPRTDRNARFIRLADLIINVDCIVTVKFSTYPAYVGRELRDVPIVNLWLKLPTGSLDGSAETRETQSNLEELEFEGDLALAIWSYFAQLETVTVLVE